MQTSDPSMASLLLGSTPARGPSDVSEVTLRLSSAACWAVREMSEARMGGSVSEIVDNVLTVMLPELRATRARIQTLETQLRERAEGQNNQPQGGGCSSEDAELPYADLTADGLDACESGDDGGLGARRKRRFFKPVSAIDPSARRKRKAKFARELVGLMESYGIDVEMALAVVNEMAGDPAVLQKHKSKRAALGQSAIDAAAAAPNAGAVCAQVADVPQAAVAALLSMSAAPPAPINAYPGARAHVTASHAHVASTYVPGAPVYAAAMGSPAPAVPVEAARALRSSGASLASSPGGAFSATPRSEAGKRSRADSKVQPSQSQLGQGMSHADAMIASVMPGASEATHTASARLGSTPHRASHLSLSSITEQESHVHPLFGSRVHAAGLGKGPAAMASLSSAVMQHLTQGSAAQPSVHSNPAFAVFPGHASITAAIDAARVSLAQSPLSASLFSHRSPQPGTMPAVAGAPTQLLAQTAVSHPTPGAPQAAIQPAAWSTMPVWDDEELEHAFGPDFGFHVGLELGDLHVS